MLRCHAQPRSLNRSDKKTLVCFYAVEPVISSGVGERENRRDTTKVVEGVTANALFLIVLLCEAGMAVRRQRKGGMPF